MSYAIGNVICGCPIPRTLSYFLQEYEIDPEDVGFVGLYSASGRDPIGYCGVQIRRLTECENVNLSRSTLLPTEQQIAAAQDKLQTARELIAELLTDDDDKFAGLGPDERKRLLNCVPREPETWIVWSSA